jgi:DNA-binding IscR family transcriptional regulator
MTIGCSLRSVWEEIRDATIDILSRTTLADLATKASGPWRESDAWPIPAAKRLEVIS